MLFISLISGFPSKHKVVTSDSLEATMSAPAPLNLPFGKLFFGFNIPPYKPQEKSKDKDPSSVRATSAFTCDSCSFSAQSHPHSLVVEIP